MLRTHKFPLAVMLTVMIGLPTTAGVLSANGIRGHSTNVPAHTIVNAR